MRTFPAPNATIYLILHMEGWEKEKEETITSSKQENLGPPGGAVFDNIPRIWEGYEGHQAANQLLWWTDFCNLSYFVAQYFSIFHWTI